MEPFRMAFVVTTYSAGVYLVIVDSTDFDLGEEMALQLVETTLKTQPWACAGYPVHSNSILRHDPSGGIYKLM